MENTQLRVKRDKVFISYSHKDREWLERLKTMLVPLVRANKISWWADTAVKPGAEWEKEIRSAIASAKVAVLLVSPDFLASPFIDKCELPPLLEAAEKNGLTIVWIAIRHSLYEETQIARYQAANDPSVPLSRFRGEARDRELARICGLIKTAVMQEPEPGKPPAVEAKASGIGDDVSRSARGLGALRELMNDPVVRANVGNFRGIFEPATKQIGVLGYYKNLHDLLHTLQFGCYNCIIAVVRDVQEAPPDDALVWDKVIAYELVLQNIVDGLKKLAEQETFAHRAGTWIHDLIEALKLLLEAIRDRDVKRVYIAIVPINRILTREPARINIRLNEEAYALPLPLLIDALSRVYDDLGRAQVNPNAVRKFKDGVDALAKLNSRLKPLIDEHDKWQEVDTELRMIEDTSRPDLNHLISTWPYLKELTEPHCKDVVDEWARALVEDIGKLGDAIAAQDRGKISQYFGRCRSRIGTRFYMVDLMLKDLCEELHRVGEPLATVLEMI